MSNIYENEVRSIIDETIAIRHYLHQNPELSFQEYKTTEYIINHLSKLENIEIKKVADTGVLGILKGAQPGKVIGLRADIDALAVKEENDVDYKSVNQNIMHACGHDAHTAMLLAAAKVLNDKVDQIKGEVIFIFQAAEEIAPGGAKAIIESGALDNMDYIFGQHVMPILETGKIGVMRGPFLTANDMMNITIQGRGGHAAMPNFAIDPVVIAAETILALQTIVSRKTPPGKQPVISTTIVKTPDNADNVIPDTINLRGSIRNYWPEVRLETKELVTNIAKGIAEAHGASAIVDYTMGHDSVINDDDCYDISKKASESFMPEGGLVELTEKLAASEDFSAYRKICPGNYSILGIANPEKHTDVSNHNPKFNVDDDALYYGIMQYVNTIDQLLIK
jgi:amidohydrolase